MGFFTARGPYFDQNHGNISQLRNTLFWANYYIYSWRFQPIWKICSSIWIIFPRIGVKIPKIIGKPPLRVTAPQVAWQFQAVSLLFHSFFRCSRKTFAKRVALWTRVTLGLDMCKVCTEAVHCVALWTRVTLGLDMCKVCTEAVHCVALWTRVTLGLDMCKVCTEAVHCVALWTRVTLGLDMCKVCTEAVHCVALWTRVTLGLDMCKVCTEAVHCVALWTRVTLGLDMCKVCTEAVHCVALWTRVTLGLDMCKVCTEAVQTQWKHQATYGAASNHHLDILIVIPKPELTPFWDSPTTEPTFWVWPTGGLMFAMKFAQTSILPKERHYMPTKNWRNSTKCLYARWAPTSSKWSYNPCKWPYKWVTGVILTL